MCYFLYEQNKIHKYIHSVYMYIVQAVVVPSGSKKETVV